MATAIFSSPSETTIRAETAPPQTTRDFRPQVSRYVLVKVVFDLFLAVVLLVIAAPVIALMGLLVKLTSQGPAFYTQLRVGRNGRAFWIYKLRTMTHNCESESGAKWATARDARVTLLGRFLRKTHLDELPQLWNVLRGDMSLVGPRPERPEFIPGLEEQIPNYRDRLVVRPGLTGLAQVQLPADTDIDSVRRKLVYDRYYIEHMGLWLDIRLILSTALKMAHIPFSVARKVLRVPSRRVVEGAEHPVRVEPRTASQPQVPCLQPDVA
jgi:lipopolysaccharide/colanic/teichoic acid biosynthesis glycosyltransferase